MRTSNDTDIAPHDETLVLPREEQRTPVGCLLDFS